MTAAPHWLRKTLALAGLLLLLWQGWYLGWVLWWRHADPGQTRFMAQRLAKNLFLSSAKTPGRKAQEALITVWLELFSGTSAASSRSI